MRIRRAVVTLGAVALACSVLWAQGAEAKSSSRTNTVTYSSPAVGLLGSPATGACSGEDGLGCVEFNVTKAEHHVSLKITDQSGQPVYATYSQDKTDAGGYGPIVGSMDGGFCGKTKKPVSIKPNQRLTVFLYEGPGPDGCPGVATSGTVTATFTK
jgi:hypothetical protein